MNEHTARFHNGMKLKSITWPDQSVLETGSSSDVESLEIVMQPGQCGYVPWALATFTSGARWLFNLAHFESVNLATSNTEENEV